MKKMQRLMMIGLLAAAPLASAHAADDAAWRKEIERRIEILTKELENRNMADAAQAPVYESRLGLAPAASKIYHVNRGFSVGGYGEMVLQDWESDRDDGGPANKKTELDFLRMILYVGHKFSDTILLNSEIEFEHASTAGGTGARGEVSVEFAYLDFTPFGKPLGFRSGMVLIPVGIMNELHEPTVFHGARRNNVENDIIPTTWRENGAGVFGEMGQFAYRAYAVAGLQGVKDATPGVKGFTASSGIRDGRQKGAKSFAEDIGWTGRVDYKGIPGTVLSVSGYRGNSGQDTKTAGGEEINGRVSMGAVHGTTEYRGLEVKALYARTTVGDVAKLNTANGLTGSNSIGERMFGGYVEVAYDLMSLFGGKQYLAPFFRWERIDTQQRVPNGFSKNPANDRTEYTWGLTYKPHPQTVIKLDTTNADNDAGTGIDKVNAAIGYVF